MTSRRLVIARRALSTTSALLVIAGLSAPANATETVLSVTQISYDGVNRLQCTAVRMDPSQWGSQTDPCIPQTTGPNGADRVRRKTYDSAGQLTKVQKGYGTTKQQDYATYTYTTNGKQLTVKDANGNLATYVYDGYDRQIGWRFPQAANGAASAACNIGTITEVNGVTGPSETRNTGDDCEKYAYDRNSNRRTMVKRDGSVLRYTYDNLNRIITKDVPTRADLTPSQVRDVYTTYDLLGRQLTVKLDSFTGADGITNTYDVFGNLASSTIAMGTFSKIVSSLYDPGNNRTRVTYPDNQVFTYAYGATGGLTGVYEGVGTATALDTFVYNADGTLLSRTEGTASQTTAGYAWDAMGRLTSQTDAFPLYTTSNVNWTFAISPASQLTSEVRNNDGYAYGGLIGVNRNYAVNGLNQYTTAGPASFTYDANGNLTADGANTYIYDIENRLVKATAAGVTTNVTYDPLGRLFQVDKGTSATTTDFLYDGDALVAEYDGTGALTNRYVHGSNAKEDDPLVWYVGSGLTTKRYLHADHNDSIVAATSASAAPSINTYDEYGIPGAANVGRFQYTGQAWIGELGMYYYKARIYSPTLGRFLQTDPIGYKDQINLYAYAGDDPIDANDPTGMAAQCAGAGSPAFVAKPSDCPNQGTTVPTIPKPNFQPPSLPKSWGELWSRLWEGPKIKVIEGVLPVGPEAEEGAAVAALSLETRAASLVELNAGRSRVMLPKTKSAPETAVDLTGRSHGGIPTPHARDMIERVAPEGHPRAGEVVRRQLGDAYRATHALLDRVENYLNGLFP